MVWKYVHHEQTLIQVVHLLRHLEFVLLQSGLGSKYGFDDLQKLMRNE